MTGPMQTRSVPDAHVRARQLSRHVVDVVAGARLSPRDRVRLLEEAESARAASRRETLGGAAYLARQSRSVSTPGPALGRLRALAARFVHPEDVR